MIKKKVKLTEKLSQQKQPWATQESRKKQELEGKVKEAAKYLPSLFSNYPDAKEASQAIQKMVAVAEAASPLHSNANEMEEEMKKGAIPFGMWHRILGQLEILEKGSQAAASHISQLEKQITELENNAKWQLDKKWNLQNELGELKEAWQNREKLLLAEKTIKCLSQCEHKLISAFRSKFDAKNFTFEQLEEKEVSVFMHLIEQAHHSKSLEGKLNGVSLKLISEQTELAKTLKVSEKERLALKFAVKMVEKKQFPPFKEHERSCSICRQKPTVFARECFPELPLNKVQETGMETKEILMMNCEDIWKQFGVPLLDSLHLGERMEELRRLHFTNQI